MKYRNNFAQMQYLKHENDRGKVFIGMEQLKNVVYI